MRLGLYHTETDGIAIRYVVALQHFRPSFYRLPEFFQCETVLVIIAASAGGHQVLNGVEVYVLGGLSFGKFKGYQVVYLHLGYGYFCSTVCTMAVTFCINPFSRFRVETLAIHLFVIFPPSGAPA